MESLEQLTRQSRFRQELFFRFNTFTIDIPPLRDRPEITIKMIEHFLEL